MKVTIHLENMQKGMLRLTPTEYSLLVAMAVEEGESLRAAEKTLESCVRQSLAKVEDTPAAHHDTAPTAASSSSERLSIIPGR